MAPCLVGIPANDGIAGAADDHTGTVVHTPIFTLLGIGNVFQVLFVGFLGIEDIVFIQAALIVTFKIIGGEYHTASRAGDFEGFIDKVDVVFIAVVIYIQAAVGTAVGFTNVIRTPYFVGRHEQIIKVNAVGNHLVRGGAV